MKQTLPIRLIGKMMLVSLALATTGNAEAEKLGRLFFTPEQRAQLELGKQGNAADGTPSISVNGIVQKHGGGRTVWINGVPQSAGKGSEHAADSEAVAIPGQSKRVRIKVGQKVTIPPAGK